MRSGVTYLRSLRGARGRTQGWSQSERKSTCSLSNNNDAPSTGADIVSFSGLNIRLDAKQIEDFGTVSAVSTDTTGTVVSFGKPFVAVTAIHVDAQGTTSLTAVYDFVSVPNPTSFKVYLFNSAGTRVSGTVSWTAKGY